jgi:hypothetical protein
MTRRAFLPGLRFAFGFSFILAPSFPRPALARLVVHPLARCSARNARTRPSASVGLPTGGASAPENEQEDSWRK